jgi:hypothetical protein
MNKQIIMLVALIGTIAAMSMAYPTRCPFVDGESGLPCMGVVMPSTPIPGRGQAYECSNGHRWIETN